VKRINHPRFVRFLALALFLLVLVGVTSRRIVIAQGPAVVNAIHWMGHQWNVTSGGMAGVAKGNPANVSVDKNGYLHLRVTNRGEIYTASELFSVDTMGFGTYQWQIEGSIDDMDKSTVLGLFLYGPQKGIGVDGENEIDIEFSRWNDTCHGCNADFTFYPATGNKTAGPNEDNFHISLNGGTLTTARFEWSSTQIVATIMSGEQPIGTTANVLQALTFAPNDYTARIPQVPLPVGMNLWCFKTLPTDDQEVIIHSFQYLPRSGKF
jgi:hypothetical protein